MARLAPVLSLADLGVRAKANPQYKKLALLASSNLGGMGKQTTDLDSALQWLQINAMETEEAGVVAEINFVRDLVK